MDTERTHLSLIFPPQECFFLPQKQSDKGFSDHKLFSRDNASPSKGDLWSSGKVSNFQSPFAGSNSLCCLTNRDQWWEKMDRLQSIQRMPLPIAYLFPGRSDSEHLSLLASFCYCCLRPFWLCASSIHLHSHHTDLLSDSLLQMLHNPIGNDLQNLTAIPILDCFKDHFSTGVYKSTTRYVFYIYKLLA